MNLYKISNDIISIEYDDSVSEECYFDTLQALEGVFEVKAMSLIAYIKNLGSDEVSLKNEIDRLKKRKISISKKQTSLKKYLLQNLEKLAITEVGDAVHNAKIRNNPVSVQITDELIIDEKYFVVTRHISKSSIKQDLKNGELIDGAELVKSKTLIIK